MKKNYCLTMTALGLLCFSALPAFAPGATQTTLAPVPLQNCVPLVVVNQTLQPSSEVYVVLTALDPNGTPCFLKPSTGTGICTYQYPNADGTNGSVPNSVALSELPKASGTGQDRAYLIYLPINSSARSYFSVHSPMYLSTTYNPGTGLLAINAPACNSLNDPNIYTVYQDFEFGVNLSNNNMSTDVFMNISYVDFCSMPYSLHANSYQGKQIDPTIANTSSGMPVGTTQTSMINTLTTALNGPSNQYANTWGLLPFSVYPNPYTSATGGQVLRILAAKNSTAWGRTFQGGAISTPSFPGNYLTDNSVGPSLGGNNYMQNVYQHYLTNELWTMVTPAAGLVLYKVSSDTSTPGQLDFEAYTPDGTRNSANDTNVNLYTVSLVDFLSGSITFANGFANDTPIGAELGKLLAGLFDIQCLPLLTPTSQTAPFYNAFNYVADKVSYGGYKNLKYFSKPPIYTNQPGFNLYDEVIHPLELDAGTLTNNPLLGVGYAFDYDDLLGMDGTIPGLTIQDQYGNPSLVKNAEKPYVVLQLGAIDYIPDLSDTNHYQVTVGAAPNGSEVVFSYSNGTSVQTTTASTTTDTTIPTTIYGGYPIASGASDYLHATFTYGGISYVFNINLKGQVVIPTTGGTYSTDYPTFSGADQQYQSNFTFSVTGSGTGTLTSPIHITINFTSAPPGWAG